MRPIEKDKSDALYVLGAFAILSVIAAHMKFEIPYGAYGYTADKIINIYGIFGVICFFIKSGYCYIRRKGDSATFWKKKSINLIVPWFLFSGMAYFFGVLLNGGVFPSLVFWSRR